MVRYQVSVVLFLLGSIAWAQQPYKQAFSLMGTDFEITLVALDERQANEFIRAGIQEMLRIERLISSWDSGSGTSEINRNAGLKPVQVEEELFDLIDRCIQLSQITDGAFDISYASMDNIWKFDGSMTSMPSKEKITESVARVGYEKIQLNRATLTVMLEEPGMKIGFGAIGKGYAADRAKALLMAQGVPAGIINASGDIAAWGKLPGNQDWKIAITNPLAKSRSYGMLPIHDGAVVTSGNYEKFVMLDGRRYAHIIDPRTGYPSSGLLSVTVFAPKAELADALATSIFVMGIEVGIDRIDQMPNVDCIIIDDQGNIHKSNNIEVENANN